ncbi:MAG: AzlC family ABC transporter permease [Symbiopectobacterium sp.]
MSKATPREQVQSTIDWKPLAAWKCCRRAIIASDFSRHVHDTFRVGLIEEKALSVFIALARWTRCATWRRRFGQCGAVMCIPGAWLVKTAGPIAPFTTSGSVSHYFPRSPPFRRDGAVWFPDTVLHDPGLAQQLKMAFRLLAQPGNTLLKEILLFSSLSWLMLRYSKIRRTLNPLPFFRTVAYYRQKCCWMIRQSNNGPLARWLGGDGRTEPVALYLCQFKMLVAFYHTRIRYRLGCRSDNPLDCLALMFAGAAQLIMFGLVMSGANIVTIPTTVFFITTQHIIYALTFADWLLAHG